MNSEIAKVRDFMAHMDCVLDPHLRLSNYPENSQLQGTSCLLGTVANDLKEEANTDLRIMRSWLMVEELGEVLEALANQDEVALLDGLADLMYVIIGTAVQFNLPLAEAFDAIHASNMTKASNPMKVGYKNTPGYKSPNLAKILEKYRCEQ